MPHGLAKNMVANAEMEWARNEAAMAQARLELREAEERQAKLEYDLNTWPDSTQAHEGWLPVTVNEIERGNQYILRLQHQLSSAEASLDVELRRSALLNMVR